jgi:hypothetical protein
MQPAPKITAAFGRDLRSFDPYLDLVWSEDLKRDAGDPAMLRGLAAARARVVRRECAIPHWIVVREVPEWDRLRMVKSGAIEPDQRFVFVAHWQGREDSAGKITMEVDGGYLPLDDRLLEHLCGDTRGRWTPKTFERFKQDREEANLKEALDRRYQDEEQDAENVDLILTEGTRRTSHVQKERAGEGRGAGAGEAGGSGDAGAGEAGGSGDAGAGEAGGS